MSDASSDPVPILAAARAAASLLVLRHRLHGGPELLMGLRGANHKFMPNRLVFPGGRVDPEDHAVNPAAMSPAGWIAPRPRCSPAPWAWRRHASWRRRPA
jgi:8-oxo-dGTP pyrophosphatase MutT (NUDIX family)